MVGRVLRRLSIAVSLVACGSFGGDDPGAPPITGAPEESFSLATPAERTAVVQGSTARIPLTVTRSQALAGRRLPIAIAIEAPPEGIVVDPLTVGPAETGAELVVHAADAGAQGELVLRVSGVAIGTEIRASATTALFVRGRRASPDKTFGTNGYQTVFFGDGPNALLEHAVLLPNGRAVAIGGASAGTALARIDGDGMLDPTFSGDGKSFVAVPSGGSVTAFASLPSGSLQLVAGGSLCRATPAGDLDATFGTDGCVVGLPTSGSYVHRFAPDGALFTVEGMDTVLRFTKRRADGALDGAFGNAGVRDVTLPSGSANPRGVTVRANGAVVAGASTGHLVQLTAAGALDATFGNAGLAQQGSHPLEYIVEQPDGRLVLAGVTSGGGAFWSVARVLADGSADFQFGSSGQVLPPIEHGPTAVVAQPLLLADGRIVVLVNNHLLVFSKDGTVDPTTGRAGLPITHGKQPVSIPWVFLAAGERLLFFSTQVLPPAAKLDFYATRIWL